MPGESKEGGGLESTPVYKKAPFTLRSGNAPLKQNIFRKKGGATSSSKIKTGLSKFFGSLTKEAEHLGKSIKKVAKTDVPKQFAGDVKKTVEKISKTVNPSTKGKKRTKKGKVGTPGRGGNIFK